MVARAVRNNQEHVRLLFEGDYVDGIGSDTLPMIEAVRLKLLERQFQLINPTLDLFG